MTSITDNYLPAAVAIEAPPVEYATYRLPAASMLDAVAWTEPIVGRRPATPILSAVRFDVHKGELTVQAFNYEQEVRIRLGHHSGAADGSVLVVHSALKAMLKALVGTRKKEIVAVTVGEGRFERNGHSIGMPAGDLENWPIVPRLDHLPLASLPGDEFVANMDRLALAASTDDTLPILTAIRIEVNRGYMVGLSTDRYRLARAGFDATVSPGVDTAFLLPMRQWSKWRRMFKYEGLVSICQLPATDAYGVQWVRFTAGDVVFRTRTVDGDYPRISSLFPDRTPHQVSMDRAALVEAVKAAGVIADRNTPARLTYTDTHVVVEATGDLTGIVETGRIPYTGTVEFDRHAFNPVYLADALKLIEGDTVVLSGVAAPKPAVFTASADEVGSDLFYNVLLMPVRLP